jgi:hypothetical protein
VIERDLARTTAPSPTKERPALLVTPDLDTGTAVAKFHDEQDILLSALPAG